MRYIRNFLILSFVFLSFTAFEAKAQTPSNGLEKKVFKELIKLPYYGVFDHIAFQIDGDTVTLYGKVFNARNKRDAERWVKDVDGVGRVVNRIEILPPSGFDNTIRRQILATFTRNGGSLYRYLQEPNPAMRIIVDNGRVTLEGYVSNRGDYNLANILVSGVSGVFGVENNLIVGREER
ncbi:MAG: BON domain-containing protein [Acidobacteria bacterium]|nr:BON domain-containing protein [Acidobacteriota bacterium]